MTYTSEKINKNMTTHQKISKILTSAEVGSLLVYLLQPSMVQGNFLRTALPSPGLRLGLKKQIK
jgi:hypothetical protein